MPKNTAKAGIFSNFVKKIGKNRVLIAGILRKARFNKLFSFLRITAEVCPLSWVVSYFTFSDKKALGLLLYKMASILKK